MNAAIEVHDVTLRIGATTLLSSIELTVHLGEVVAIVGPNGAGKSSLLNVLAGDRKPQHGSIRLMGRPLPEHDPRELARVRSMLTQTPAHEIGLSVRELVELARYPYQGEGSNTAEADRAAVSQALEVVEMTEMADRVVSTLSGGERLRAHAARVLAQATPIVLLDEPTAALDIAHQERLLGSFTRIAGRDRCVVAVLHDLNAAARHADRILVLDRGHKVADGHPGDVLEGPLLTDVYGHPIEVVAHPIDGGPLVLVAG